MRQDKIEGDIANKQNKTRKNIEDIARKKRTYRERQNENKLNEPRKNGNNGISKT